MNNCVFTGYLVENPRISRANGVARADFTVVVYDYRRTKSTSEKARIPTYLDCQAWHTGAETLAKFAERGSKITISASARHHSRDDDRIIFRINEFDLCNVED